MKATFISSISPTTPLPLHRHRHRHSPLHLRLLPASSSHFASPARRLVPPMASHSNPSSQTSVLFVCLGNICRSPAAEGVFRGVVQGKGLQSAFSIDSAGTIDYHQGNPADSRMRAAAKRRGVEITSISRPIRPSDFAEFDIILAMDKQNKADILKAFDKWKGKASLPSDGYKKVRLMCSYCKKHKETEVPDPYYGGPQGFEHVKCVDFGFDYLDKLVLKFKLHALHHQTIYDRFIR